MATWVVARAWSAMASREATAPPRGCFLPRGGRLHRGGIGAMQFVAGRPQLVIAGVPVGKLLPAVPARAEMQPDLRGDVGSIIIVVANRRPALAHAAQAPRPSGNQWALPVPAPVPAIHPVTSSSPFRPPTAARRRSPVPTRYYTVSNERISPLFEATVEATEEAIVKRHGRRPNHDRHRRPHHRSACPTTNCQS